MATSISNPQPEARDGADERPASRTALVLLLPVWIVAFAVCSDGLRDGRAIAPTATSVRSLVHAIDGAVFGVESIAAIGLTALLGVSLALTRLLLPERDRSTLGLLIGAWLVTLDVAALGERHPFLSAPIVVPILNTLLSVGALRVVITAAVRRWNVQLRRAAI